MDRSLAEKGWMFSTWLEPGGDTARGCTACPPRNAQRPRAAVTSLSPRRCWQQPPCPRLTVLAPNDVSDGDAPDLRVAEAEQEGPVGLRAQELADVLLADEADDEPGGKGRRTACQCQDGTQHSLTGPGGAVNTPLGLSGTHLSDQ